MPACRPIVLALKLLLLVSPALSGASPSPGSDPQPPSAAEQIVPADLIAGTFPQSDEIVVSSIEQAQLAHEAMPDPDRPGQSGEKDRRAGIREWAVRLVRRCEADIAWRYGRVAAR